MLPNVEKWKKVAKIKRLTQKKYNLNESVCVTMTTKNIANKEEGSNFSWKKFRANDEIFQEDLRYQLTKAKRIYPMSKKKSLWDIMMNCKKFRHSHNMSHRMLATNTTIS